MLNEICFLMLTVFIGMKNTYNCRLVVSEIMMVGFKVFEWESKI